MPIEALGLGSSRAELVQSCAHESSVSLSERADFSTKSVGPEKQISQRPLGIFVGSTLSAGGVVMFFMSGRDSPSPETCQDSGCRKVEVFQILFESVARSLGVTCRILFPVGLIGWNPLSDCRAPAG